MVRYYCNKCETLLSASRYTVVVKLPDGTQQNAVHLCSECYKKIYKSYEQMNSNTNEEDSSVSGEKAKEEIAKQLGITSATSDESTVAVDVADNTGDGKQEEHFTDYHLMPNPKIVGKFSLKEELPGKPRSEKDIPKIRRILIDFYREVSPRTTQSRLGMDNITWRRWVAKYASTTVYARWGNYKRFAEAGSEKAIDTDKVLTLAGGGFPIDEIAKEVFCDDVGLINEILCWYTGV